MSAEVAAGVFYQERRALLAALKLLLSAAAAGPDAAGGPATPVVHQFVGSLLAERRGGRSALLSRILSLVQVFSDCWAFFRCSWKRTVVPAPSSCAWDSPIIHACW